jgi:hypothetical protein
MSFGEYVLSIHKDEPSAEESLHKGYKVTYPDGYVSWSPKDVFEKAYYKLSDPEGNRIVKEDVENFIAGNYTGSKVGLKTSCITATLKSGYEITESSSCVDPHYFDYAIGEKICLEKISDKVWALLGFLLQCGKYGMK